jgi:hypothetical protein
MRSEITTGSNSIRIETLCSMGPPDWTWRYPKQLISKEHAQSVIQLHVFLLDSAKLNAVGNRVEPDTTYLQTKAKLWSNYLYFIARTYLSQVHRFYVFICQWDKCSWKEASFRYLLSKQKITQIMQRTDTIYTAEDVTLYTIQYQPLSLTMEHAAKKIILTLFSES